MTQVLLVKRWLPMIRWLCVLVILGVSVWAAYYAFGLTLEARWMIIDDHCIALLLGSDRRFTLAEFIPALLDSEVGRPGQEGRFRPAYYVLQLTEALFAADSAGAWYGFRIAYFAILLAGTWLALYQLIGFWGGLGITLWISSVPIWQDIFARLGPGESYAAMGLGVYLPTLVAILLWYGHLRMRWRVVLSVLFFFSSFVLMGSKENWLVLLLPSTIMFACLLTRRCADKAITISYLLTCVYGVAIAAAVAIGLRTKGHVYASVYGSNFSDHPFWEALQLYLQAAFERLGIPSLVLLVASIVFLLLSVLKPSKKLPAIRFVIMSAILVANFLVLFVWNKFFYSGNWLILKRYAFPGEILDILMWGGTFALLSFMVTKIFQSVWIGFLLSLTCFGFGYTEHVPKAFDHLRGASSNTVGSSAVFSTYLEKVVSAARADPKRAIVVEVTGSGVDWEFEPAISVVRFLNFYGLGNRLFLRLHGPTDPPTVPELRDHIVRLSQTGKLDGLPKSRVKPIFRLKNKPCFSVEVKRNVETNCESLGQVPL